eukprot:9500492-Pyramimonas_sp.AAC.1
MNLAGPLPSELGLLTALAHVTLSEPRLVSALPTQLGQLTNLVTLRFLQCRNITGTLPTELGRLTAATSLEWIGSRSVRADPDPRP